jgi:ubiquinone/menaquinone biosynthesis C-methylase UbiE
MSRLKTETTSSFYDAVAKDYNSHMTASDEKARKKISQLFMKVVKKGCVLDFGGGTGLDVQWLLENQYSVLFLEPSQSMREIAIQNISSGPNLHFVDNVNFNSWSSGYLPFGEKVVGVLANFAVLNCINNIEVFFEKINLICEENSVVVITILNSTPTALVRNYSLGAALRVFLKGTHGIKQKYNDVYHQTYLHSIPALKKAAHQNFEFIDLSIIEFSNFVTLIFRKK